MDKPEGLDLIGIGKLAKAIPPEVYKRSAATALSTFEKLVAPITESTSGFGRYLRQRFDNMVEVEKALAAYTLERAYERAKASKKKITPPAHPKSFVKTLVEASTETDPLLHEMWTNLLARQMDGTGGAHPHFVEVLGHLGPQDAALLLTLAAVKGEELGWIHPLDDRDDAIFRGAVEHPLSDSCHLLDQIGLATIIVVMNPTDHVGKLTLPQKCRMALSKQGLDFRKAVGFPVAESAPS